MEPRQYSIAISRGLARWLSSPRSSSCRPGEWGSYPETFRDLPAQEQAAFLKEQGYASVRDLLTHVAVWWEEGRGIIADTIKQRRQGRAAVRLG